MSQDTIKIIKVKFNPKTSQFSDIFDHPQSKALWCLYRSCHIISEEGLECLNKFCRNMIKTKEVFTEETAKKTLVAFEYEISDVSHSMEDYTWINDVIPYLTGEKQVQLEMISE